MIKVTIEIEGSNYHETIEDGETYRNVKTTETHTIQIKGDSSGLQELEVAQTIRECLKTVWL